MKVLVDPSHASKVVAVQVWVQVGSADELPEEAGLAHVHEHMLFKGTERRQVGEIAAAVEGAGGEINAYTSFDQTVYHVTIASREVDTALDILADAVRNSAFEAGELEKELEVVLEELRRGKDSPGRVVSELLFGAAYGAHNYGRPIIGFVDTVEAFTRDQILAFYRKWYQPSNMLLVVSGDVEPEAIFSAAERLFPELESASELPPRPRVEEPAQEGLRFAQTAMDVQESHLSFCWHGPSMASEDTPAIDVLSVLLGTGESSRLYRKVKRDLELVTDCYAYAYTPQDPGLFGVGAQVQGQPLVEAFSALLKESLRLRHEAPSEAEIQKAKTIVLSEAVYGMQTVQGRARKLGFFEMVAGGVEKEEQYRSAISAVTADDVLRVAKKYLDPMRLTVAAVRPAEAKEASAEDAFDESVVRGAVEKVVEELSVAYRRPDIEALDLGVCKATLSNGATVLVQSDDSVPIVSLIATSKGGLLDEDARRAGVSHLAAELLTRGTTRFSADQISETCDAMAGGLAGQSGRNSLGLRGDFLKESWPTGLELFTSCLLEPVFAPEEIERERRSALEGLAARADHPSAVAFDQFAAAMYGEHPYSRPTVGTEESLKGLTRDDILDAYRTQLRPDALTITVVGDVSAADAVARLERAIGHAKPHADARRFEDPVAPEALEGVRSVQAERDKAQAQLVFGFAGLTLYDERRFALEVMTQVLGGQSGRLFLELRDKQSLAYSVGAFGLEGLHRGYLALHIGTHPDKLEVAERGMRLELEKMCETLVSDKELARAKRYLTGAYEIGLQRPASRASTMALNEAYGVGYDAHARHAEKVEAVTAEMVRDIARELVDFDHMVRSVVGPASALLDKAS